MIPIYCFAAYSNTGKTTYIEKLVAELTARHVRVAVIKHDAHRFEIDKEGKDSWRFAKAGAAVVAVASDEQCAVIEKRKLEFDDIVAHIHDVDIIITEGYKHGDKPKIGVYRNGSGNGLALPPEQLIAVVTDTALDIPNRQFPLDDPKPMADFLVEDMKTRF